MTDAHMTSGPVKGFTEDSMPPQQAMANTHMMSGLVKGFAEDSMPPRQAMTDAHMTSGPHATTTGIGYSSTLKPMWAVWTLKRQPGAPRTRTVAPRTQDEKEMNRKNTLSCWFQATVQYEQYEQRLIRPQSGTTKWALWQGQQQRTETRAGKSEADMEGERREELWIDGQDAIFLVLPLQHSVEVVSLPNCFYSGAEPSLAGNMTCTSLTLAPEANNIITCPSPIPGNLGFKYYSIHQPYPSVWGR
ncbi:hypothetical protein B0H14DRAFT_3663204 [Mycena olivaceomarginata]|nr:hypothetical protein B0H14DRAFT_3663204 [Mycena olivaceomarginata]